MRRYRKAAVALAATAVVAGTLSACGSSSDGGSSSASSGGTIYYLTKRPAEHLDPQRTYIGRDLADMNRLVYRQLVSFPVTDDPQKAVEPQADLATDTGTSSNDAKTWKFTIKDGVKWQDGKAITCEDFKYGVSRTFATDVIIGGPNYVLGYLDVPTDAKTGLPTYDGPYKNNNAADFDKAITCDGNTITYNFKKPFPDFPLAIASLNSFGPYRKDQDQGDKSNYEVFSSGPYKLEGKWDVAKGGTFVRNTAWDKSTDEIRTAKPDKFVFTQGLTNEIIADRMIADAGNDKYAVTDRVVPPAYYSQITGEVEKRSTLTDSPFVDYVLPNFNKMKNLKVRQALMLSTNVEGWITAGGGDKAYKPAKSIVNPALIGYKDNPNFTAPPAGDIEGAKKLLAESGEKLPYPIKFTYNGGTPTSDKQAAALKDGWDKAGFKVTLDPLTDTYYDIVQKPSADFDVTWGGWGADWPSIATVIPPLFDSRINLTKESNGQDYGNYKSDAANKLIDEAAALGDVNEQAAKYAELDDQLGKDVAYVPLEITRFYFLHGSKVADYIQSPASNGYPELGAIAVSK
ncbi:ABC transporter substrate-binding protein [Marmoricola sp. RAF53]|uniref:ABC transporter substrate-binding protein n=1 Tax=Marmoricola sp. RAF53 TaxID=3233059 RepID=UPI003F9C0278